MSDPVIQKMTTKFEETIAHLQKEYAGLQTGRASAALVENIMVDYYGTRSPLKGIASISVPEASQIAIQPWSRDALANIEKAILESNIGLTPNNNGILIRLTMPPMTEERRKDLIKVVHKYAEEARIAIRNSRQEAMTEVKKEEKEKVISEDALKLKEEEIQKKTDEYNKKIEESAKHKEQDITKI